MQHLTKYSKYHQLIFRKYNTNIAQEIAVAQAWKILDIYPTTPCTPSRNKREGYYYGKIFSKHFRSNQRNKFLISIAT